MFTMKEKREAITKAKNKDKRVKKTYKIKKLARKYLRIINLNRES